MLSFFKSKSLLFTVFAKARRTLQATVVFSQVKFSWIFKSRLENLKEKG